MTQTHPKPEKGQRWKHKHLNAVMVVVAADSTSVRLRNEATGFFMRPLLVEQLWEHYALVP